MKNHGGSPTAVGVSGPYAYVAGGPTDVEVIDVSNPASPQRELHPDNGHVRAELSRDREAEARGLLVIPHKEVFAGQGGRIPGFALESPEASQLTKLVRLRIHQDHLAALSHDQKEVPDQE